MWERGEVNMREVGIKLTGYIKLSEIEENLFFNGTLEDVDAVLSKVVAEGRLRLEGECYASTPAIREFNDLYDTEYCDEEICVYM